MNERRDLSSHLLSIWGTENKHQVSLEPSRTPGMFFYIKPREGEIERNRAGKSEAKERDKVKKRRLKKGRRRELLFDNSTLGPDVRLFAAA